MALKKEDAPKVSIIWINYNSLPFINISLESLRSLFNIEYLNYEVIIVDNGSTDKSIEIIEDFIEKEKLRKTLPRIKVIKNHRNFGFVLGNFIGYKKRDKNSKYVAIVNNDLLVEPSSLSFLVNFLENHQNVGAVQGKILALDSKKIDNCGFYFDSMFRVYPLYNGLPPIKGEKEALISFASGCYSIFRIEALEKCGGLFGAILPYFGYFDDADMCIRLWRKGYRIVYVPIIAGYHKGGASFSKYNYLSNYLNIRNRLSSIFSLRDIERFMIVPWVIYLLSRIVVYLVLGLFNKENMTKSKYVARALVDVFRITKKTKKIDGNAQEPRIKLRVSTIIKMTFLPNRIVPLIQSLINDGDICKIEKLSI